MQTDEPYNYYLIPGMGADERLYTHFNLPNGIIHKLKWWPHEGSSTLKEYAHLLAQRIETKNNIIIGSSMGGMVASELSHILKPIATIFISAPTGRHQFPSSLKFLDRLGVHRILSPVQISKMTSLTKLFMDLKNKEQHDLFFDMLKGNGKEFLHFSVGAVLGWDNVAEPYGEFIQIIGSEDKLFKKERIPNAIVVEGGGHFTAYEKAAEVCQIIEAYISERKMKSQ